MILTQKFQRLIRGSTEAVVEILEYMGNTGDGKTLVANFQQRQRKLNCEWWNWIED